MSPFQQKDQAWHPYFLLSRLEPDIALYMMYVLMSLILIGSAVNCTASCMRLSIHSLTFLMRAHSKVMVCVTCTDPAVGLMRGIVSLQILPASFVIGSTALPPTDMRNPTVCLIHKPSHAG